MPTNYPVSQMMVDIIAVVRDAALYVVPAAIMVGVIAFMVAWFMDAVDIGGKTFGRHRQCMATTLTSPVASSTSQGTFNLSATSTDLGLTGIQFKINHVVVATDNSSPYTYAFNSLTYPNGSQVFTATSLASTPSSSPDTVAYINNSKVQDINVSNQPIATTSTVTNWPAAQVQALDMSAGSKIGLVAVFLWALFIVWIMYKMYIPKGKR